MPISDATPQTQTLSSLSGHFRRSPFTPSALPSCGRGTGRRGSHPEPPVRTRSGAGSGLRSVARLPVAVCCLFSLPLYPLLALVVFVVVVRARKLLAQKRQDVNGGVHPDVLAKEVHFGTQNQLKVSLEEKEKIPAGSRTLV